MRTFVFVFTVFLGTNGESSSSEEEDLACPCSAVASASECPPLRDFVALRLIEADGVGDKVFSKMQALYKRGLDYFTGPLAPNASPAILEANDDFDNSTDYCYHARHARFAIKKIPQIPKKKTVFLPFQHDRP